MIISPEEIPSIISSNKPLYGQARWRKESTGLLWDHQTIRDDDGGGDGVDGENGDSGPNGDSDDDTFIDCFQ